MKGIAALSPAMIKLKQIYPMKESLGIVATTTSKKQGMDVSLEEGTATKEKADPIVAFSRPPPLPPFLGPLIALSLLESWSSHDGNDD
ncbi:uncharacterized protein LOC112094579 [Morus notabilis]|uniref:uncharacterized protein LOC112094579 n=1 Tax=Morus notabilis TaxID=981085 RepID=UPI000CED2515|nr:uncharacterized protein LOC112094579 [Morus notabilis]